MKNAHKQKWEKRYIFPAGDTPSGEVVIILYTMAEGPGPDYYAVCSSLSKTDHWGKVILEKHQGDAIQL